jgi:hypothetical protein
MNYAPVAFSYDDLVDAGALDNAPAQVPILTNRIHRTFNRRRVKLDNFPEGTYEALEPAFRLASKFVTQPRFCKYLVAATNQDQPSRKTPPDQAWTMKEVPINIHTYLRLIEKLHDIADNYSIHFNSEILDIEVSWAGAASFPLPKMKDYLDPHSKPRYPEQQPILTFHRSFWAELATSDAFKQASSARKIGLYFYLAVQLAHEVAHLVHLADRTRTFADRADDIKTVDFVEGRYDRNDSFIEAGFSWEKTIFGGHTHHIEGSGFHERGIALKQYSNNQGPYYQALPVEYMGQFFSDDFWRADAIPLPGASAPTAGPKGKGTNDNKTNVHRFELDLPSDFIGQQAQRMGLAFPGFR